MEMKTLMDWNRAGFMVKKGSRHVARDPNNVPLFSANQVQPKKPKNLVRRGDFDVLKPIFDRRVPPKTRVVINVTTPVRTPAQIAEFNKIVTQHIKDRPYLYFEFQPVRPQQKGPTSWMFREAGLPDAFGRSAWRDPNWGKVE